VIFRGTDRPQVSKIGAAILAPNKDHRHVKMSVIIILNRDIAYKREYRFSAINVIDTMYNE
jgi:hypothetical protein